MNIGVTTGVHATEPNVKIRVTVTQFPATKDCAAFVTLTFLFDNANTSIFLPDLEAARAMLQQGLAAVTQVMLQRDLIKDTLIKPFHDLEQDHNAAIVENEIRDSTKPTLGDA